MRHDAASDDRTDWIVTERGHDMSHTSEHYALAEDEAEAVWFLGCLATLKATGARTGGAFTMVEFTHPPGFATPQHMHHAEDEAFYVLAGAMRGFCGDRTWRATVGSFVWLPRGIPHGYAVEGDETLRTLAMTLPGGWDGFIAEAGEPARERTLPPPGAPNIEKLLAAGDNYGIETLGPPEQ